MAKKQSSKVQPAEEIRIGSVKAAIWRNDTENGVFFNVTFQRLYRTEEGQWQSTMSFGPGDLLVLAKVADAAHTRLLQLTSTERKQERRPPAAA
jgi:hypothetical protein